MDASQAIAELTEISPQVRDVAVVGADGAVAATNIAPACRVSALAERAVRLLEAAATHEPELVQLEAATVDGSVFVVREGERLIVATTAPEPTVGLVFYDLKTCLRSIAAAKPKPKARRKPPAAAADDVAS